MSFNNFLHYENTAVLFEALSREDQLEITTLYADCERALQGVQARNRLIASTIYKVSKKVTELCGEDGSDGSLPEEIAGMMVQHQQNDPVFPLYEAIQEMRIPFNGTIVADWPVADQKQHWIHILFVSSRRRGEEAGLCTMAKRHLEHFPDRAPFA
jgi:hypothetical protein